MNYSRKVFLTACGLILLNQITVSADSVRKAGEIRWQLASSGVVSLNSITVNEPSDRLSAIRTDTAVFSAKSSRSFVGIVTTGFAVPDPPSATIPNPEPATMVLLGSGLTGLGWAIRRRRRSGAKAR